MKNGRAEMRGGQNPVYPPERSPGNIRKQSKYWVVIALLSFPVNSVNGSPLQLRSIVWPMSGNGCLLPLDIATICWYVVI
jgi:hypothetical protein